MEKKAKTRLWVAIGAIAVAALWLVSATCNFLAGYRLSPEPDLALVMGGASVAIDILKAVMLFVLAAAAATRRYAVVTVAAVVFVLAAGWSLRSASYMTSTALMTKQEEIERAKAVAQSESELLSIQAARAGFLSQQRIETAPVDPRRRSSAETVERVMEANAQTTSEYEAAVAALKEAQREVEERQARPLVDPLVWLTGYPPATVILWQSMGLAVILELCSAFGFWMIATAARPRESDAPRVEAQPAPAPVAEPPVVPALEAPEEIEPEPLPADTTNVIQLRPINTGQAEAFTRDVLARLVEPGTPEERVRVSALTDLLNAQLPRSRRLRNSRQLIDLMYDLGWEPGHKRQIGGNVCFVGCRLKDVGLIARKQSTSST